MAHPNPYLLVDEIKNQLHIARDQQIVQIMQKNKKFNFQKNLNSNRPSVCVLFRSVLSVSSNHQMPLSPYIAVNSTRIFMKL